MYRASNLTTKEKLVLKLLAAGLTNLEIAASLKMSLSTVKTHIEYIYNKTGFRNRVSVSIWAVLANVVETNILIKNLD